MRDEVACNIIFDKLINTYSINLSKPHTSSETITLLVSITIDDNTEGHCRVNMLDSVHSLIDEK